MPIQCITTPVTRHCNLQSFDFSTQRERGFPASTSMLHMHTLTTLFCHLYFQLSTKKYSAAIHVHGKKNFYCFRLMFNAPVWPFRMDWALESPILIGLCIQCWNQNKLVLERLSAFNKSASNITHSTVAAQKLAFVGIRFTVQCENSA